jgi:hypothetical protein
MYLAALCLKLVPKLYLFLRRRSIGCVCILNGYFGYSVGVGVGGGDLFVLYEECSFFCIFEGAVVDVLGLLI